MTIKKTAALITVAATTFALAACGSDGDSGASGGAGDLIRVYGSEPQNPLLPGGTNETGGGRLLDQIYAGLIDIDAEGEAQNDVAEEITTDDSRVFKVSLKEDRKFSDGTPVTAESFVKAWNYTVANSMLMEDSFANIKGYAEGVDELEGLTVEDDYHFTIELEEPQADFELQLGSDAFKPLPEVAYDDMTAFGENPVGNGPYKVDQWNHNQDITLVSNEEYVGDNTPENDGLQFVFYPQLDAAYADLLAGNLDVLDSIPDMAYTTYEQELDGRSVNEPVAVYQGFTIPEYIDGFDGEEGHLRRQAISMAIDRQELIDTIFDGTRTPASEFTALVIPGFDDDIDGHEVLEFNPEKAKELWEEANEISPFTGEFGIAYNADGGHQPWVDGVMNQLRNNLGIDAVGNPFPDFKSFRDEVTNRDITTAFRSGWQAQYPSAGYFLGPQYLSNGSSNDGEYSNPEFDAKYREALAADDLDDAAEKFNDAQKILLEDLPQVPLWYGNVTAGWSENVDNVEFSWKSEPVYHAITRK